MSGRTRTVLAVVATLAVLGPIGWMWQASLLPASYSVMDMGQVDEGRPAGGPATAGHAAHGGGPARGVEDLVADPGQPDVDVTLIARKEPFHLASGRTVDGYTLNGTSPGPTVRVTAGQLVQVRLVNETVPSGITLHWHGVDVPNADDGVAGVTQNAVALGESFTYRFRAGQVGTFWYHSHQVSHEQVAGGLFGALVVAPAAAATAAATSGRDEIAIVHLYDGQRTINGRDGDVRLLAEAGETVRVRVVNTDNGPMPIWVSGAPYRLLAVDGTDLHGPGMLDGIAVELTAGARADLEVTVPAAGVRVEMSGSGAMVLGPPGATVAPTRRPASDVDLLTYGTPAPLGFDPATAHRWFDYAIGRRLGFLGGVPGLWWTVNGALYPDVPMYVVSEGDVVRMRVTNDSGEVHPMHLHGHHAVVLARDGVASTGSPWWVDSLNVRDGESYDIAFVADNPGIWMDHCHQLVHAREGLSAHLVYEGVTTRYHVGSATANTPE